MNVADVITGVNTKGDKTTPYPGVSRYSVIQDSQLEVAFFESEEGAQIPAHAHGDAKTAGVVISGEVECTLDGARTTLTAGSTFVTPAGEPHGPFHYKAATREVKLFLKSKEGSVQYDEVEDQYQIKLVKPNEAQGEARRIYDDVIRSEGPKWLVPLWGFYAHSPTLLGHWWGLLKALEIEPSTVPKKLIGAIAMMTAIEADCKRCTSYHQATLIDRLGIPPDEVEALRDYETSPLVSEEERKVIRFARNVAFGGPVTAQDMRDLRQMGYTDTQIVEIVSVATLEAGFARRGAALSKFEDVFDWPAEHIPSEQYSKHLAD